MTPLFLGVILMAVSDHNKNTVTMNDPLWKDSSREIIVPTASASHVL